LSRFWCSAGGLVRTASGLTFIATLLSITGGPLAVRLILCGCAFTGFLLARTSTGLRILA